MKPLAAMAAAGASQLHEQGPMQEAGRLAGRGGEGVHVTGGARGRLSDAAAAKSGSEQTRPGVNKGGEGWMGLE